jgi:hypothetical protein
MLKIRNKKYFYRWYSTYPQGFIKLSFSDFIQKLKFMVGEIRGVVNTI